MTLERNHRYMDYKDDMLGRIRTALGRTKAGPAPRPLAAFPSRAPLTDRVTLAHQFQTEVEKIGGQVTFADSDQAVKSRLDVLLPDGSGAVAAVCGAAPP